MGAWSSHRGLAIACVLFAVAAPACESAPQRRVISLSDATTQVAAALGLGDRLGALDPRAPNALERALATGADLAISDSGSDSADVRAALASRSIAVRTFAPRSTADTLAAYTEIATVLGKPKAAAALIERVTRELQGLGSDGKRPRVALVTSRKPLRALAGDAFVSHVLALAGVTNAFEEERGVVVALRPEQLDAQKAERVIDVSETALAGAWVEPVATAAALRRAAVE